MRNVSSCVLMRGTISPGRLLDLCDAEAGISARPRTAVPIASATGMTMSEPEAARAWESADGFAWSSEDWFPAASFWLLELV